MDLADLTVAVTTNAAQATKDLNQFVTSAQAADTQQQKITASTTTASAALDRISGITSKAAASFTSVGTAAQAMSGFLLELNGELGALEVGQQKLLNYNQLISKSFNDLAAATGVSSDAALVARDAFLSAGLAIEKLEVSTITAKDAQVLLTASYEAGEVSLAQYDLAMRKVVESLGVAEQEAIVFGKAVQDAGIATAETASLTGGLIASMTQLGLIFGAIESLKLADEYEQLQGKLKVVTASTGDYAVVSEQLYNSAIKTGTALSSNITLYQQLSIAAKGIQASDQQLTSFVDKFDELAAVFKLDGSHLNATILDLSHALESGTVKAQQFNRLMLAFPALGQAVATGLGIPMSQLKDLITDGEISSQKLFDALQVGLQGVDAQFASLPAGLARSLTSFKTAMSQAFGNLSDNNSIIQVLAGSITLITNNIGILGIALGELSAIIIAKYATSLVAATVAATKTAGGIGLCTTAMNALSKSSLAFIATPIGGALAVIATATFIYTERTTDLQRAQESHTKAVVDALAIEDKLKVARGQAATDLQKDQDKLIEDTKAQIANNIARLEAYNIKLPDGAGFGAFGTNLDVDETKQKKDIAAAIAEERLQLADLNSVKTVGMTVDAANLDWEKQITAAIEDHTTKITSNTTARVNALASLQQEYDENVKLVAARAQGIDQFNKITDQVNAENAARSAGLILGTAEAASYEDLYTKNQAVLQSLKDKDTQDKADIVTQTQYNALLKEFGLLGDTNAGTLANQRLEQLKTTQAYKDASPEFQAYIQHLEDIGKNYEDDGISAEHFQNALKKMNDEYNKTVAAQAKPFIQASENIQQSLGTSIAQGITDGFGKGQSIVQIFANTIKQTLITTLSNALAAQITSQFVNPILASAAGALTGNGDVQNSVGSQLGVKSNASGGNLIANLLGDAKTTYGIYNNAGQVTSLPSQISNYFSGTASASGTGSGLSGLFTGAGSGVGDLSAASTASDVGSFSGLGDLGSLAGAGTGSAAGVGGLASGLGSDFGISGASGAAGSLGSTAATAGASGLGTVLPVAGALFAAYNIASAGLSGHKVGPVSGAAQGALAGAAIGSVVPVIGTAIGAIVGGIVGAIGGSLGPSHPEAKVSEFQSGVTGSALSGTTYGTDQLDTTIAKSLVGGVNSYLSSLKDLGINVSNSTQIRGGVNSNQGNKFDVLGASGLSTDVKASYSFDPNDQNSVASAIAAVGVELAKGANVANKSLSTALQNIKTTNRSAADITSDLAFAAGFDTLGQAPKVIGQFETSAKSLLATFAAGEAQTTSLGLDLQKYKDYETTATKQFFDAVLNPTAALDPLQQQLADLKKTFDDLRAAAQVLGYSLDTVNAAQKAATEQVAVNFNASLASQIQQIVDPTSYAIAQLDAQFVTIRADAVAAGGSLTLVNQLYALQLAAILKNSAASAAATQSAVKNGNQLVANQEALYNTQITNLQTQITAQQALATAAQNTSTTFHNLADTLTSTASSLLIGNLSPLSPEEQYKQAQSQFNTVSSAALGGDQTALGQLPDISKQLLTASQAYNGSFAGYVNDFNHVQDILSQSATIANNTASIADQQLAAANNQISLMTQQVDLLTQVNTNLQAAISTSNSTAGVAANANTKVDPASLTDAALKASNVDPNADLNSITWKGITLRQYETFERLAGYSGLSGGGGWNAYAKANPSAAATFNELLQSVGVTPVQFASGGWAKPGQPFIAGDNGPEVVWPTTSTYISSHSDTSKLLGGGSNAGVVEAVKTLAEVVQSGNTTNMNGIKLLHEALTQILSSTKEATTQTTLARFKRTS